MAFLATWHPSHSAAAQPQCLFRATVHGPPANLELGRRASATSFSKYVILVPCVSALRLC